jgi:hypothetical protein
MVTRIFIYSFFILFALNTWSQSLTFEINSTKVAIGERVELRVVSEVNGSIEIKTPKAFRYGSTEQSSMQQQMDHSGRFTVQMSYIRDGYFETAGSFTVGPVILRSGKKVLTSNTLQVVVSKTSLATQKGNSSISQRELQKPAFGVIQASKTKLYEGEAVVLEAKVLAKLYPDNMNRYRAYSIDGSVSNYTLGNAEDIKSGKERLGGIDWQTFLFDRKVLFFNRKGNYKVKPFDINLEYDFSYLNVKSNIQTIEVIPLPDNKPDDFIGVVGELTLSCDLTSKPIKKGEVLTFQLVLKGKGNIQNALAPVVRVPKGWEEYAAPKPTSSYTYTEEGAEGVLTYTYSFKCLTDEPTNWEPITLSYFDPENGKYKTLTAEAFQFNGKEVIAPSSKEIKGDPKEMSKTTLVQQATEKQENESPFKSPILWLTLASIVAFAFFIGVLGKPKFKKQVFSKDDLNKPYIAKWSTVEVDLDKAEKSYQLEERNEAIQHIENAVSKAISIYLKIDYREVSSAFLLQSFMNSNANFSLKEKAKAFFYQAQVQRYGFGLTDHEWQLTKEEVTQLIKELKN